jgi:hypothetical protein
LRLERRYRKKRWVFPIRQQYPRPLDPARRFGSRLRYRSQLRGYDGSKLASQGKTVVVAMEDRLNVIGFLAHPAHSCAPTAIDEVSFPSQPRKARSRMIRKHA